MTAWNRIMDLAELEKLFQKPFLATIVEVVQHRLPD